MTNEIITQVRALREALDELVGLKRYKAAKGKDRYYEAHQPKVWVKAHTALTATEGLLAQLEGNGWHSILSAPKTHIIFLANEKEMETYCRWRNEKWCFWGLDDFDNMGWVALGFTPTHWMDKPLLPTEHL